MWIINVIGITKWVILSGSYDLSLCITTNIHSKSTVPHLLGTPRCASFALRSVTSHFGDGIVMSFVRLDRDRQCHHNEQQSLTSSLVPRYHCVTAAHTFLNMFCEICGCCAASCTFPCFPCFDCSFALPCAACSTGLAMIAGSKNKYWVDDDNEYKKNFKELDKNDKSTH